MMSPFFVVLKRFFTYTPFLPSLIVVRPQMAELDWGVPHPLFRTLSKIVLRSLAGSSSIGGRLSFRKVVGGYVLRQFGNAFGSITAFSLSFPVTLCFEVESEAYTLFK